MRSYIVNEPGVSTKGTKSVKSRRHRVMHRNRKPKSGKQCARDGTVHTSGTYKARA